MIVRIDKVKGMLYETNTKKRTSWRWREASQMDPKEIEITKHLKLRISLNRLSSTRVRPSYTLFFSDGDESFHIHLANTTNQDRVPYIILSFFFNKYSDSQISQIVAVVQSVHQSYRNQVFYTLKNWHLKVKRPKNMFQLIIKLTILKIHLVNVYSNA